MPQQISITEVVARIRSQADGDSFVVEFIQSTGKEKGRRKRRKCRYGMPVQEVHTPTGRSKRARATAGSDYRDHVENGTFPLTNLDARIPRPFTPLISHLIGYNQYRIRH